MKFGRVLVNGIAAVSLVLSCTSLSWSATDRLPQLVVGRVTTAPVIDGKLDDQAWSTVPETGGFTLLGSHDKQPIAATYIKAVTDGNALYFGVRCVEPKLAELKPKVEKRDGDTWLQESVEWVIDPIGDRKHCYHMIANITEGQFDSDITEKTPGVFDDNVKWDGDWEVKTSKGDKEWYAEVKIPFSTIGVDLSKHSTLGFTFNRARWADKGELSCWSCNRIKFVELANMGEMIIPSADETYSRISFPRLATRVTGAENEPLEFINHTNSPVTPKLTYKLTGPQASTGSVQLDKVSADGKISASLPLSIEKPGSYKLFVDAVDAESGKALYSFNRDIDATLPIVFDESLYAMYYKRVDATVDVRIASEGAQLKVVLTKDGAEKPIAVKTFDAPFSGPVKISFKMAGKKEGTYRLIAELVRNGKSIATAQSVKYPYKPNPKVGFTKDGFMKVDGKPFFPLGIYSLQKRDGTPSDDIMREAKEAGMNTTVLYHYRPTDPLIPMLDACQKAGLKALIYPTVPFSVRKGDETPESMRHDIEVRRNHPALIGWYVVDEPEGIGEAPVQPVRDLYQFVKEQDQDHPCAMVIMSPEAAKDYRPCTDIMWIDPYPVPRQPVTAVSDAVSGVINMIEKDKPMWCIPQAFDWSVWNNGKLDGVHRPTGIEERNMAYLALVNGAKGMIFWAYGSSKYYIRDYPEHWAEVKKVVGEVHDLTPVLLTKTVSGKLSLLQKNNALEMMLKKFNGSWYALVVNSSTEPCEATFKLPGVESGMKLDVLFEGRSLTAADSCWKDSFKPLEVHVFKVSAK